jgi:hypothetical protein
MTTPRTLCPLWICIEVIALNAAKIARNCSDLRPKEPADNGPASAAKCV